MKDNESLYSDSAELVNKVSKIIGEFQEVVRTAPDEEKCSKLLEDCK